MALGHGDWEHELFAPFFGSQMPTGQFTRPNGSHARGIPIDVVEVRC